MNWQMWPKEDEYILGQVIIKAWEMVVEKQDQDSFLAHSLEEIVAQKVDR
jgi:hypothetical protein